MNKRKNTEEEKQSREAQLYLLVPAARVCLTERSAGGRLLQLPWKQRSLLDPVVLVLNSGASTYEV